MVSDEMAVTLASNLRDVGIALVWIPWCTMCEPPKKQWEDSAKPSCPAEERYDPESFR